jgi:hypothetical protein
MYFLTLFFRKPEPHNSQRPNYRAADFPVSTQSPAEGPHGFYNLAVFLPQFLLPDRKNGLTSMKPFHHHQLDGLILHLFPDHFPPPNSNALA